MLSMSDELRTNEQWACYDMRHSLTSLLQFMKKSAVETSEIWTEYETKIDPYNAQQWLLW